jgi:UTP--glucose-1-phosphate uridylyltransferase
MSAPVDRSPPTARDQGNKSGIDPLFAGCLFRREGWSMTQVRKAVFPVGGLGTRFLPATKSMPKEMLPVVDKPLIQYAVEEAQAAGIEEFIFVTGRSKTAIEDHFDHSYELEETLKGRNKAQQYEAVTSWLPKPGQIAYTRQQEPLGLGHAVLCAKNLIGDEPFAVLLADDLILAETPCLKQMVDAHQKLRGNYVAVLDVPREHTNRYGILDVEDDDGHLVRVKGVVEKPEPAKAPSTLSIIGRYILEPEVFEHLTRTQRGAGGEIQLTDGLAQMIRSNRRPFMGLRFEGRRFDCGDKVGFLQANIAFALARPEMNREVRRILSDYC